ncbi:MAG: tetraacyldisaccharide 4'-kinase [Cyclobacteriaceae bacterium]|nr:tetraacyldisaccharide 4'-kinase [Cyclobacteriaceae bacterium]
MKLRVPLLFPFTLPYIVITSLRNHLFNIGYRSSFNYDIMTISVGNLSVGGTGKTPMVEYLIRLLKPTYSLATLSRGYKRKSKGFVLAKQGLTVTDLGDEPFQYFTKYGKDVVVAVGEERALAIPKILMEHPETQAILLDDAFQHRTIDPDLNILLTRFDAPFFKDYVLPSGMLRETRKGAKRADAVIVTKCPNDLSGTQKANFKTRIEKYTLDGTPVFFSSIQYGIPQPFTDGKTFSGKVILFAGLANMKPLTDYVEDVFELVETKKFGDHHEYTLTEVEQLVEQAKKTNTTLLTTEKDITKLRSGEFMELISEVGLFYLPISVQFLFDEEAKFNELVHEAIKEKYTPEEEIVEAE